MQYCRAKMHVNACKVWKFNLFLREIWVQTQIINKNCTINEPKRSIFKKLSLICTRYLLFWFIHSACLGSSGFQDLFGTKNHGYSISGQIYDFCPRLRKLDILDCTLSHILTEFTRFIHDNVNCLILHSQNIEEKKE